MKKQILGFALAAVLLTIGIFWLNGCASCPAPTAGSDPGKMTTPDARVSGGTSISGTKVNINLNAIIRTGSTDAVEGLTSGKFEIYVGTTADYSTYKKIDFTMPTVTSRAMDMVFILDNTGSMASRIQAVKNSIAAFATTLEAGGADVKFGACAFGDYSVTKPLMGGQPVEFSSQDITNAAGISTWCTNLTNFYGYDGPENPLDSVMYAYKNFTWRAGAQKVFIVITDVSCKQVGTSGNYPSGDTTQSPISDHSVNSVIASLEGNAVIYSVSPDYTVSQDPYGDVRKLADGLGETRNLASGEAGTGGRWIDLSLYPGNIDLTTLGIDATVTKGYTLTFDSPITSGTLYVHIRVDTDGDGVFDSDGLLSFPITTVSTLSIKNPPMTKN